MKKIAVAFSYPLCTRNFIHSGLLNTLVKKGFDVRILSPYKNDFFEDEWGNMFPNTHVPTVGWDEWGTPLIEGAGLFHKLLVSIRIRGYSIEYPNGSLQTMELSKPTSAIWFLSWLLVKSFPRKSAGRKLLRKLYDRLGPKNKSISKFFATESPDLLITATMGHLPMDFVSLTEAKRKRIKTICILLSWDNLYSRGPVYKHPDKLLVWSKIMEQQAINVHQFPKNIVKAVGPLQFVNYAEPVSEAELESVRKKFSLEKNEKYILYVCGGRTPQYDIDDIKALQLVLKNSSFSHLKLVVRPHPQVDSAHYSEISDSVYLDYSPSLIGVDNPDKLFDKSDVRHMASLLDQADFVISSWGTTVLLEACIFNKKVVQLNWYDSIPHENKGQSDSVRNFQNYYHMKEFDSFDGRLFSKAPSDLIERMMELNEKDTEFSINRLKIKTDFTYGDYGKVTTRVTNEIESLLDVKGT